MRILFSKNSFAGPISGADEIVATYAIHLKEAGHSTEILLVHKPASNDPLVTRLNSAGIVVNSLASRRFSSSLAVCRKLAIKAMRTFSPASNLIRSNSRRVVFDLLQRYHDACCEYLTRHRPDVVHILTPDPGAVMLIRAAHATQTPVIYHEVGIPFHPPGFEEVYQRFVSVLPLCSVVAVLSPRLADEMKRVLPQINGTRVIPLISEDTTNENQRTKGVGGPIRFGFAARLEHLKGPLQLAEAFRIAHQVEANIQLRVAGEGSQRNDLEAVLRSSGLREQCEFTGVYASLEERGEFMRGIDVFVLPSLTEGTPNAIIEAMSHGRPVIATRVGGIPDVVTEDVGVLVEPENPKELAEAMVRLAQDEELRRRMGKAARDRYQRLFTPEVVLPVLTDCYRAALNGRSGNHDLKTWNRIAHPWVSNNHH